ncbi:hypothetical protein E2562_006793 [Oryza meyeriana var. granulata]|uniref:Uncharacterized protein n=1 Tax=Oryza meyeriana var. granulata TaxID=110450 RepID=A0A6G1C4K8_9ORYZ|nr:hypothetical protein E2562_006793 [Oryza meyeriana var. granulata]
MGAMPVCVRGDDEKRRQNPRSRPLVWAQGLVDVGVVTSGAVGDYDKSRMSSGWRSLLAWGSAVSRLGAGMGRSSCVERQQCQGGHVDGMR